MGPEPISRTPTEELENSRNHHLHHHQHQQPHHHDHQLPSQDPDEDCRSDDPEYLFQLIRDRRTMQSLPSIFLHLDRLLDEEITRVHNSVLYLGTSTEPLVLPEPQGPVITLSEKLAVPVKEYPDFNFVGRLLGPRGMTAKQLEIETGCRILVRGRGSLRDKRKEEQMKGKTKWEHLNEDLHVLICVEDSRERAQIKLSRAIEQVQKLLVPSSEGEDELKKRQLLELALLNGTYKGLNNNNMACPPLLFPHPGAVNGHFSPPVGGFGPGVPGPGGMMGPGMLSMPMLIRTSDHAGAPIILPQPLPIFSPTSMTPLSSPGGPPQGVTSPGALMSPAGEHSGFLFHLEPCLMSPTTPTSPMLENPLHKPPPLMLQHPQQHLLFQQQFQQQQQQQQQLLQQDLSRSAAAVTLLPPGSIAVSATGVHGAGPSSLFFAQR